MSNSAPSGQYTLFVGDLSIFCTEDHLREAFEEYGELLEVKIIRCEETKKNLSYGFVKYAETDSAVKAIEELDGAMVCGRPLRIGWASRRNRNEQMVSLPFNQTAERSSVHVTYSSYQIDNIVTEEFFVKTFSKYGEVIDAAVKRFEINEELHFQKGYGFVHFPYTPEGVASALKCCDELHNRTVDKVTYKCNISHRLKQCMNGGVSDEEAYAAEYGDFGYPQVVMVNPMSVPGIPVGYAYNSAGVMVPLAMAMPVGDSYQYVNPFVAMSQYQSQFQGPMQGQMSGQQGQGQGQTQQGSMSPPFGPVATPQMFPHAFPQPYAQVANMANMPGMVNMMSYPQSGYYNQLGAVAGPYSWQYPYCNSAGEQTHLGGANGMEQSNQQQGQQQGHQQNQHGGQHQGPQSAHSATTATSESTGNTIVTGFAVQKPTAAAIAAAVHGDSNFMYATPGSVGAYAHSLHHGDANNYGFHNQHYTHGYDHGQSAHHQQGHNGGNGQGQNNGSNTKTWAALFANNNSNGHGNGNNHGHGHGHTNVGNGYTTAHAQLSATPMVAFLPAAVNTNAASKLPFTSVGPSAQYGNGVYPRPRSGSSSASASSTTAYSAMIANLRSRRDRPLRTTPITTVQRSSRSPPSTTTATGETKAGAGAVRSPGKRDAGMEVISGVKSPDSDLSDRSYDSTQHTTSEDTALDSTPVPEAPLESAAMEMAVVEGEAEVAAEAGVCGTAMMVVEEKAAGMVE